MKTLIFLLMTIFSVSALSQSWTISIGRENSKDEIELSDDYLSLINQKFEIMKRSIINNYKVQGMWMIGDSSEEYAVIVLKNENERLVALGRIINSSKKRIKVLFKDIKKVEYINKNDGFALCTINRNNQIIAMYRSTSDKDGRFEKYWDIDFSNEKFSEFTVDKIQTLDKVERF